jgi:RNA polymerase sigma factor (sigma-70 family)
VATINLRDFYPWYTHDEFLDVTEEIEVELFADRRYHKAHERRVKRNRAQYSLDAEDGIEASAIICLPNSPEAVFEMMERHCSLCQALNSLPEIQGRRIEAYYILGKSQAEIASAEGVSENAVSKAIERGLVAMKKYLKNFEEQG